MIKRIFTVVILSILTTIASGCSMNKSPESLMRPPKLESDKEQVKIALQEYLPQNARLVIPPSKDKPSAIKFMDLDGDKQEEVIIFYNLDLEENPLRALILKNENKKWTNKGELKIIGQELDKVFFKDINGDRGLDIIIGSKEPSSLSKSLNIYSFKNGNINQLLENTYEHMIVEDLNRDGLSETILLKSDREKNELFAELYKYSQSNVLMMDKIMFKNIDEFNSIKEGNIYNNIQGVIISGSIKDHILKKYILTIKDDKLLNVIENDVIESEKVPDIEYILPQDIDKDGIMEFAIANIQESDEDEKQYSKSWITEWYSWDGKNSILLKKINYYDKNLNFSFNLPLKWKENIIITNSRTDTGIINDEEWVRVEYKESGKNNKHHLFTVYIYTDEGLKKIGNNKNNDTAIKALEDIDKNYFIFLGEDIKKSKNKEINLEVDKIVKSFEILTR